MSGLPSPLEAWHLVAPRIESLGTETVSLKNALGHYFADDLTARWDHPRADLSAMDGYACCGRVELDTEIRVVGEVAAGERDLPSVVPGRAAAIMTGGWIPPGTDRVIPVEATTDLGADRIEVRRSVEPGANIRRRGEVHAAGDLLIASGTCLDAVHLGVAASEGYQRLEIVRRPRVGVLVTGNEVLASPPEGELPPGALLDSHTPLLTGLCRRQGVAPKALGIAGDDADALASRLDQEELDVVITTGGVSVGRYDLVPEVALELGFEILVHRVAMQPGKPLLIGYRLLAGRSQWIIGLPGNPAAVLVGFQVFVACLLRGLAGSANPRDAHRIQLQLATPVIPHRSRTRYLPATVVADAAIRRAALRVPVGSHDLAAFAGADALLEVVPGPAEIEAGSVLPAVPVRCGN